MEGELNCGVNQKHNLFEDTFEVMLSHRFSPQFQPPVLLLFQVGPEYSVSPNRDQDHSLGLEQRLGPGLETKTTAGSSAED